MTSDGNRVQVAVVGAGPGGYPAAFLAADMGMKVALIDDENAPGGVCLHRGCIPSKALLHVATLLNETREAAAYGVTFSDTRLDVDALRGWKESVVKRLTGGLAQLTKQRGIEYIRGRARFSGPSSLTIELSEGGSRTLEFEQAILATGASPARIAAFPESPRVMDSTAALALEELPARLLVVGGGYIGLELGQAYAGLGSDVSVVEVLPNLLSGADPDLVRVPRQRLSKQFAEIFTETKVVEMKDTGDAVDVVFEDAKGGKTSAAYDRVLVSVGRCPNTDGLGLEAVGIALEGGFVRVDSQRRTTLRTVFAVGDVAGQPMLAHKATYEAKVAVEAIAGRKTVYEPRAIPAVVFTDPEVAWCGMTEAAAREAGVDIVVGKFPWAASGRALTLGRGDGLTKIITEAGTGRVLGVGLTGPGAGELIAEGALAVEMGAVAEDLAWTIHAHPTLSETMMEAAEAIGGHSTHFVGRR